MGLYDDQECKSIINEKSPWEVVKGPNEEVAISSRYAVFYRNGSLDEVQGCSCTTNISASSSLIITSGSTFRASTLRGAFSTLQKCQM